MLSFLGKIGKGAATLVGIGGVATGGTVLSLGGADLNETLRLIVEILTALSALLASAGFGRKTGYAAVHEGQKQTGTSW